MWFSNRLEGFNYSKIQDYITIHEVIEKMDNCFALKNKVAELCDLLWTTSTCHAPGIAKEHRNSWIYMQVCLHLEVAPANLPLLVAAILKFHILY